MSVPDADRPGLVRSSGLLGVPPESLLNRAVSGRPGLFACCSFLAPTLSASAWRDDRHDRMGRPRYCAVSPAGRRAVPVGERVRHRCRVRAHHDTVGGRRSTWTTMSPGVLVDGVCWKEGDLFRRRRQMTSSPDFRRFRNERTGAGVRGTWVLQASRYGWNASDGGEGPSWSSVTSGATPRKAADAA